MPAYASPDTEKLVAVKTVAQEEPPESITIENPRCVDLYVAEDAALEDWPDLEEMEWEADEMLKEEPGPSAFLRGRLTN
jgi:hypothetical protein